MKKVFLSASVPAPDRDPKYFGTADVVAIRDSIKALVTILVSEGKLVFGGHPAISPLVWLLARNLGKHAQEHIVIFMSEYFRDRFPPASMEFDAVRFTPIVQNDRSKSLALMRRRMVESEDFDAAFFVGGMEGVEEEFALFRELHVNKPVYPVASTGAAARILFEAHCREMPKLRDDLAYPSLFRSLLE